MSLEEVFAFLAHFRAEESLCRGTVLWKEVRCLTEQRRQGSICFRILIMLLMFTYQVSAMLKQKKYIHCFFYHVRIHTCVVLQLCGWLKANEGSFRPPEASTSSTPEAISVHSARHLKAFLTVPADSGETL